MQKESWKELTVSELSCFEWANGKYVFFSRIVAKLEFERDCEYAKDYFRCELNGHLDDILELRAKRVIFFNYLKRV